MTKFLSLSAVAIALIAVQPAFADDTASACGWLGCMTNQNFYVNYYADSSSDASHTTYYDRDGDLIVINQQFNASTGQYEDVGATILHQDGSYQCYNPQGAEVDSYPWLSTSSGAALVSSSYLGVGYNTDGSANSVSLGNASYNDQGQLTQSNGTYQYFGGQGATFNDPIPGSIGGASWSYNANEPDSGAYVTNGYMNDNGAYVNITQSCSVTFGDCKDDYASVSYDDHVDFFDASGTLTSTFSWADPAPVDPPADPVVEPAPQPQPDLS